MKRKQTLPTFFVLAFVLLLARTISYGQSTFNEVFSNTEIAIKNANAPAMSRYLAEKTDLTLNGKKGSYSRNQAVAILKDFFLQQPISEFRYVHKGASKNGIQYAIAKYFSGEKVYRIYMVVKEDKNVYLVETLDISLTD